MRDEEPGDANALSIVFVSGFPRSGTTWFANVLNSHPGVLYRHELLGRQLASLDPELASALKAGAALDAGQRRSVHEFIVRANEVSDRPPFFAKSFLPIGNARAHQLAWLGARAVPALSRLYERLYTPKADRIAHVLIKETRSMVGLDAILAALEPAHLLFLVRHPCAVVASHLSGVASGLMNEPDATVRESWVEPILDARESIAGELTRERVLGCSVAEFTALRWCAHVHDQIALERRVEGARFVLYEALLSDPKPRFAALFESIGLGLAPQTASFLERSGTSAHTTLMERDASDRYFSVYRDSDFDPHRWRRTLSESDRRSVLELTAPLRERLGTD